MGKLDGQCGCGAVTYTSDADPVFAALCHCKNCQRHTGSPYSSVVGVPVDQFELQGDLSTFVTVGEDHGQDVRRRFCPECGSSVLSESDAIPGIVILRTGTINDTSWLGGPQLEVWGSSAQPWVQEHAMRVDRGPQAAA